MSNNRYFKIIIKCLVVCSNQPMIDYNRSSEQCYSSCIPSSGLRGWLQFLCHLLSYFPPFSSVVPSTPAFPTSLFMQSSRLSRGLPLLLLPSSPYASAVFVRRSSAILSTCPAHFSRFSTVRPLRLFRTPVSSQFVQPPLDSLHPCYLPHPVLTYFSQIYTIKMSIISINFVLLCDIKCFT